ncbi:MAG: hypothetical protein JNM69_07055, partial [Archangium sp.]|nr:hypothetical protein [Archangium sp.]
MRSFTFPLFASAALLLMTACPTKPPCATTCTGCCDSSGVCQLGSQSNACGKSGAVCKSCSVTESCSFGSCMSSFAGTGGGSSG